PGQSAERQAVALCSPNHGVGLQHRPLKYLPPRSDYAYGRFQVFVRRRLLAHRISFRGLSPVCPISRLATHAPELQVELETRAGRVHDLHARGIQILPVTDRIVLPPDLVELEVGVARMVRNLPGRDRQRTQDDAGKLRIDESTDSLAGADLRLPRK